MNLTLRSERRIDSQATAEQVVGNAHSFLLAGFETTAVLVLFTLLHLAHAPAAQVIKADGGAFSRQNDTVILDCRSVILLPLLSFSAKITVLPRASL